MTCLYYAVHRFFLVASSDPVLTVLAQVRWPQPHPDRYCMGKPVEVWCPNLFESFNCTVSLLVENMQMQVITSEITVNSEYVRVIVLDFDMSFGDHYSLYKKPVII